MNEPSTENLRQRFTDYRRLLNLTQGRQKFDRQEKKPSAEAQQVWELIDRDIGELGRLRAIDSGSWPEDPILAELLSIDPDQTLRSAVAWQIHDQLSIVILDHSRGADLTALIAAELSAQAAKSAPLPGSPQDRLSTVSVLLESYPADAAAEANARALLRIIWREKARQRGEDRQLRRTRTDYLNQWSFVLIPLVVLLLCMISLAAVHPQTVVVVLLLTAFAGAAGSTLGGVLRLRDLPELTNIRNLKTGIVAQPLVGGVAALFLFLLLESHIVVLPGVSATGTPSWQALGIYGFVAGFSEPFFIGILGRVANVRS